MFFLEIPIAENTELSSSIISYFEEYEVKISKEEIITLIREKKVYFQGQPVGFIPFKVFKKGRAQIYLDQPGWEVSTNDILFEDKWIIVINKPSGIPSQSSLKLLQDHAYSAVMCMLRKKKPFTSPQLFLLHRLDMDTSGVLLMTKKPSINKGIQHLFEKKQIKKTYWGVSKTEGDTPKLNEKIISHLARKPNNEHNFRFGSYPEGYPGAKLSETHFDLLKSNSSHHLYEVHPQTGRSHQIRVHMSENGHAIVGDSFYEGEKNKNLFLHAKTLSFIHPETKENISIKAPLPPHWVELLDKYSLNP